MLYILSKLQFLSLFHFKTGRAIKSKGSCDTGHETDSVIQYINDFSLDIVGNFAWPKTSLVKLLA